jgi:hypothetical protein
MMFWEGQASTSAPASFMNDLAFWAQLIGSLAPLRC